MGVAAAVMVFILASSVRAESCLSSSVDKLWLSNDANNATIPASLLLPLGKPPVLLNSPNTR